MTSKELIGKLSILDENVLQEAARQPVLFIEAAQHRVDMMRKRAHATARLEYLQSAVGLKIRAKPTVDGKRKNNDEVNARVTKHSLVIAAKKDLEDALAEEELAKLILQAHSMRRDAIRIIAEAENIAGTREGAEVERIEKRRQLVDQARRLEEKRRRSEL
jgi:stage III sporulation protein SpoIIIAA